MQNNIFLFFLWYSWSRSYELVRDISGFERLSSHVPNKPFIKILNRVLQARSTKINCQELIRHVVYVIWKRAEPEWARTNWYMLFFVWCHTAENKFHHLLWQSRIKILQSHDEIVQARTTYFYLWAAELPHWKQTFCETWNLACMS